MRPRRDDNTEVNADAFLDTVANLVGILTILFVVVAVQSKSAAKAVAEKELKTDMSATLEESLQDATIVEKDLVKQARSLRMYEMEIMRRSAERERLLAELILAKETKEEASAKISKEDQDKIAAEIELSELQKKIAALLAQHGELDQATPTNQIITLQHLPTPMAKTVFGEELHVLLEANRLSVIPWDNLVAALKRQAEMQVSRVIRANRVVDTLGPWKDT